MKLLYLVIRVIVAASFTWLFTGAALAQAQQTPQTQTVKIGFAAPLSGGAAHYGKDFQYGTQLAVDAANEKHLTIGGRAVRFQLDSADDQGDPRIGAQVAQRLVDNGVVGVVGHFNSGTSIPASRIYAAAGVPQITSASATILTQQGIKSIFRVLASDRDIGRAAGVYAAGTLKAKRIAVIDDRTAWGQGIADNFIDGVKSVNGNIVAREYTNDKAVDFRALLTSIKAFNADLIYFGGLDQQAAALAQQIHRLGLNARLMGTAITNQTFVDVARGNAEGTLGWDWGEPLERTPAGKTFTTAMNAKYNVGVVEYAPFGYDAVNVLIQAMQAANSTDPKRFSSFLSQTSLEGVTAKIQFVAGGDMKDPAVTLSQVKNGKWVFVTTVRGS
jgi:branched-chain amino acid transport system substrate-binding protein